MRNVLFLLALTPSVAFAGAKGHLKWHAAGAKQVEIEGTVEVPLYRGEETDALPAVLAHLPAEEGEEHRFTGFLLLDLALEGSTMTEGTLGKLGATIKERKVHGVEIKVAVVPELHVGDLVIRDLNVLVGKQDSLGLATIEELAVAVLPSQGVVRFAPAASADALLAEVGPPVQAVRLEIAKWFWHGKPMYGNGTTLAVPGAIGETEGLVVPGLRAPVTAALLGAGLEGGARVNTVAVQFEATRIGDIQLPDAGLGVAEILVDPEASVIGVLGHDVLYTVDVALDPSSDRFAFAEADAVLWEPTGPKTLELAQAAFEKAEEKGDEEETDAKEEEPPPGAPDAGDKEAIGRHKALADAYWTHGGDALAHYEAAAKVAGDNCSPYFEYGAKLLRAGRAKEAVPHLEKAGMLWDRWYGQDLDLRSKVKELSDKGKTYDEPEVFTLVQPSTCHEAWGELALAYLAAGDHAAVEKVFTEHGRDTLDGRLPLAYAASLLQQGLPDLANGPLRRAVNLGLRHDGDTRVLLAASAAGLERKELVDAQLERIGHIDLRWTLGSTLALLETLRQVGGDADVDAALAALLERNPLSVTAGLAAALEAERRGDDAARDAALDRVEPLLLHEMGRTAGATEVLGWRAVYEALRGDAEAARATLEQVDGQVHQDVPAAEVLVARLADGQEAAAQELADYRARAPMSPFVVVDVLGSWPAPEPEPEPVEAPEE